VSSTRSKSRSGQTVVEATTIARPEGLLESIAERSAKPRATPAMALPSGRTVRAEATPEGDRIRVESASGDVELEVTMTPTGPLLRFRAADLQLAATGEVSVDCEQFTVRAEKGITHETGGNAREVVGGDKLTKVRGTHAALARRTHIESKRGDVAIIANDDVQVVGERVKLNC
jgi:hypothetical protein